jgi:RHS repeat-associated protein
VKRTFNGGITYFIYDGEKPVLGYNGRGVIAGRNVYGKWIDEPSEWGAREMDGQACEGSRRAERERTSQILRRTYGNQTYYFQQDRNGNVTHLTNASGVIVEQYKYDAFGAVTIYNGSGVQIPSTAYNNRFLFTGREYGATYAGTYIPAFTFYEYRARAYNPTLGRFMSEDPKGFDAGDYNLFRYCHNDPLDRVDPMGLDGFTKDQFLIKPGDQATGPASYAVFGPPLGSHIPPIVPTPTAADVEAAKAQGGVVLRASYAQINQQKLGQLGSVFRPMASRFIDSANEMLNPEGYEVKIADQGGYRSFAEQARLRANYEATGQNQANRPGESAHNYGAAFDVDIIKGSRANREIGPRTYNSLIGRLGALGEGQGLIWGGRFTKPDLPHFQYRGIPVDGRDILRLHQQLLRTTGAGLDAAMGLP